MGLGVAVVLGFIGFVTSFGAHVVAVNLPGYAQQVGVGLAMIGLLIASYDLAEIVAKPAFGFIADRVGMKRTLLIGILFFVASSLLYLAVPPRLLLLIRFLQGAGAAALSTVSVALVGVYYAEGRGRAYGVYNAMKGAGYVVSPAVGGALVARTQFAAIFVASALVGALALLMALTLPRPAQEPGLDDDDLSLKTLLAAVADRRLLPWYAVIVVNMFFVGILFGFVPVRLHALHYTPTVSGLILSLAAVSYVLVQPIAGRLADRLDPVLIIRTGLLVSALGVLLVPMTRGVLLASVCVAAALGVGTVWTNTDAAVSRLAREGRMGTTMGVAGSFKELGDMAGPLLIGTLSQAFGLTVGFAVCGGLGLLALAALPRRMAADQPRRDAAGR